MTPAKKDVHKENRRERTYEAEQLWGWRNGQWQTGVPPTDSLPLWPPPWLLTPPAHLHRVAVVSRASLSRPFLTQRPPSSSFSDGTNAELNLALAPTDWHNFLLINTKIPVHIYKKITANASARASEGIAEMSNVGQVLRGPQLFFL